VTVLLECALQYAGKGWPVFPLEPGGKRPLGRLAPKGLHNATTDRECIERWWNTAPDANIGIRTGIAFDALDVDGPEALDALRDAMPLAGDPADDPNIFGPMAPPLGVGTPMLSPPDAATQSMSAGSPASTGAVAADMWSPPDR